jgi:hypothetical protein
MKQFKTRAVLFKEKVGQDDCYIVVGLDYDIAVQGKTPEKAIWCFYHTFLDNISLAKEMKLKPMSNIGKSPKPYWDLYENGTDIETPGFVKKINLKLRKTVEQESKDDGKV